MYNNGTGIPVFLSGLIFALIFAVPASLLAADNPQLSTNFGLTTAKSNAVGDLRSGKADFDFSLGPRFVASLKGMIFGNPKATYELKSDTVAGVWAQGKGAYTTLTNGAAVDAKAQGFAGAGLKSTNSATIDLKANDSVTSNTKVVSTTLAGVEGIAKGNLYAGLDGYDASLELGARGGAFEDVSAEQTIAYNGRNACGFGIKCGGGAGFNIGGNFGITDRNNMIKAKTGLMVGPAKVDVSGFVDRGVVTGAAIDTVTGKVIPMALARASSSPNTSSTAKKPSSSGNKNFFSSVSDLFNGIFGGKKSSGRISENIDTETGADQTASSGKAVEVSSKTTTSTVSDNGDTGRTSNVVSSDISVQSATGATLSVKTTVVTPAILNQKYGEYKSAYKEYVAALSADDKVLTEKALAKYMKLKAEFDALNNSNN